MNSTVPNSTPSSETSKNITSFANAVSLAENYKVCGKYWAATSGTRVVTMTLIPTIEDKDVFNAFRDKAREALAVVGEIATGEIQVRDGQKVFVKRLNRNNEIKGAAGKRTEPIYTIPHYLQ